MSADALDEQATALAADLERVLADARAALALGAVTPRQGVKLTLALRTLRATLAELADPEPEGVGVAPDFGPTPHGTHAQYSTHAPESSDSSGADEP